MARDRWKSRTVFLLAAIGSAVGLGNVWRFPYLTYKFGGGAFLIPYLVALFVVGIPLLILEFALGQKIQKGAIGSFKAIHSRFGAIGLMALMSSFIIVAYYAVVMAWSFIYMIASLKVPWASDSKGYFFNNVLQITDGVGNIGGINWMVLLALAAIWILIYFCVWKGTESVGKIVAWTVPLPVILLGILFVRGITLPGFLEGWVYYLRPDWNALLYADVWIAAIGQIFFTLTLAFGVMIAYASFNKEDSDIRSNGWITAITNSSISIFAGFVVFAVLGYMAMKQAVPIADVATSGPGLAFVVFPQALSLMPWAGFFSVVFFVMLLTLGIDSAFSLVEAVDTAILDGKAKWKKQKLAFVVCLAAFLCGIIFTTRAGLYFLDIVDHFVMGYNLVFVGLLQCLAIGWVYGADKMRSYINQHAKVKLGRWWNWAIKVIIPAALIVLLATQFWAEMTTPYEGYPAWALRIGWAVFFVPLMISIAMAVGSTKE
ncbi:TPA: sodium-dependent transporter [Candidatus Woesearchaeota archaeon]|nr:sodium-dependent transporter [Candidatus Woesearchaeota archaeon]